MRSFPEQSRPALRDSLLAQYREEVQSSSADSPEGVRWLAVRLEVHVARWAGLRRHVRSLASLVESPGFWTIQIGAELLSEEIARGGIQGRPLELWNRFLHLLAETAQNPTEDAARELEQASREFRGSLS